MFGLLYVSINDIGTQLFCNCSTWVAVSFVCNVWQIAYRGMYLYTSFVVLELHDGVGSKLPSAEPRIEGCPVAVILIVNIDLAQIVLEF